MYLIVALACSMTFPGSVVWASGTALRVPMVQPMTAERRAALSELGPALSELGRTGHFIAKQEFVNGGEPSGARIVIR